jgi:hypothetical protein
MWRRRFLKDIYFFTERRSLHSWFSQIYKRDDHVHGFRVHEIASIPDFHVTAIKLEHEETGLRYLHLEKDDRYNVFAIAFETLPTDDSGIAHILEHLVLCGSQRYPIRDPFFKMLNRSLACYMNALTSSDHTCYPFSTINAQDFNNLLAVYLDAVFRPLLREEDFRQEGWRLEHELTTDRKTPLKFKQKEAFTKELQGENPFLSSISNTMLSWISIETTIIRHVLMSIRMATSH